MKPPRFAGVNRTVLGDLPLPPREHQRLAQRDRRQEDRSRERVACRGERRSGRAEQEQLDREAPGSRSRRFALGAIQRPQTTAAARGAATPSSDVLREAPDPECDEHAELEHEPQAEVERLQRSSSLRCSSATCSSSRVTRSSSAGCAGFRPGRSSGVRLGGLRRRAAGRSDPGSAPADAAGARRAPPRPERRAPSGRPRARGTGRGARPAASAHPVSAGRGASAPPGARSARGRGRVHPRAGACTWRRGCRDRSRGAPSRGATACRSPGGSSPRRSPPPARGSSPGCTRAATRSARAGTGRASSAASRSGSRAPGSRPDQHPRPERYRGAPGGGGSAAVTAG